VSDVKRLRFLTDGMLGKLTRWLRMLGHNVRYANALDDKALMKIARTEKRILLTRDLELCQQAMGQHAVAFLVEGANEVERLATLSKRFNLELELNPDTSRCPRCNGEIRPVEKDRVTDKIPANTRAVYQEFWECSQCGKIYWQGAHWKKIMETLNQARKMLRELDMAHHSS
jgi:uncharacterized protein with PIN domain